MRGAVSPRKNYCPFLRKLIALFPEKMIALFSENSPPLSAVHAKTFKLVDTFPLKNTEKLLTFLNLLSQFPYPTYVSGTPCIPLETSYLTAVIVVLSSAFSYAIYGPVLLLCVEIVPSFHRI